MKISLIFVINGEDHVVEANPNQPLKPVRNKALEESKNLARPMDDWEVRTEQGGVLLNPNEKVENLGLAPGSRLLLTLAMGGGGSHANGTRCHT